MERKGISSTEAKANSLNVPFIFKFIFTYLKSFEACIPSLKF